MYYGLTIDNSRDNRRAVLVFPSHDDEVVIVVAGVNLVITLFLMTNLESNGHQHQTNSKPPSFEE